MKPTVYDLYCGLGGWSEGFLAEGYDCIGFDVEAHDYGTGGYPGKLILRDVRSIHGSEMKGAAVIVASPPCQAYSYRAMPWSRAKALPPPDNTLFNECFRIQREASEAAGHYIPLIVENVRGAQKWVGRAQWHYGSFYLWGDVPALMPMTIGQPRMKPQEYERRHGTGSWFGIDMASARAGITKPEEIKTVGHANIRDGHTHTRHLTNQRESDAVKHDGSGWTEKGSLVSHNLLVSNQPQEGYKTAGMNWSDKSLRGQDFTRIAGAQGVKFSQSGDAWSDGKPRDKMLGDKGPAAYGSRSNCRKAASAMIAKIPFELSSYLARHLKPEVFEVEAVAEALKAMVRP